MDRDDLTANPWLKISAADYESHMGQPSVRQSQFLEQLFCHVIRHYQPRALLVPGCTTGNGFSCIDPKLTTRIVGIDINAEYLRILEQRHRTNLTNLETICGDINLCHFESGAFDLIHCALLFEYVHVATTLSRLSGWLAPGGRLVSVVQLPDEQLPMISMTPFRSLEQLSSIMKHVDPEDYDRLAVASGLRLITAEVCTLESGKKFRVAVHQRPV